MPSSLGDEEATSNSVMILTLDFHIYIVVEPFHYQKVWHPNKQYQRIENILKNILLIIEWTPPSLPWLQLRLKNPQLGAHCLTVHTVQAGALLRWCGFEYHPHLTESSCFPHSKHSFAIKFSIDSDRRSLKRGMNKKKVHRHATWRKVMKHIGSAPDVRLYSDLLNIKITS